MFAGSDVDFGGDLVARNIQRGRDHGIPGFCCYYNLIVDSSFDCDSGWDKRYDDVSQENWELLRTIYDKPSDIDIFTGGLAQDPHNGGLTGQVFQQLKCKIVKDRMFQSLLLISKIPLYHASHLRDLHFVYLFLFLFFAKSVL